MPKSGDDMFPPFHFLYCLTQKSLKMKRLIFFSIFSISIVLSAFGQFKITGIVKDDAGNRLPGVIVTLNGSLHSVTDEFGEYYFNNLSIGEYTLQVKYIGFEDESKTFQLSKDLRINFTLVPDALNELDEVIVSGTRLSDKAPFAYTTIQQADIEKNNLSQDIPYLLQTTPSVVTTSDAGTGVGYTQMFIRGTDNSRINVTLNGVPMNDPESHGVWWVDIPDFAASASSIQIQRGVGTSTNGAGAFGATINIRTNRLYTKPYAEISNSFGSFNTYKNSLKFGTGSINEHFTFDGRFSNIHSDGYIDRAWANLKSIYLTGAYFNKKTLLRATFFSGIEETYQAWAGVPKDSLATNRTYNPYTYENEIDHYGQTHYQLHFVKKFYENLNFNASAFFIHGGGYYEQYKEHKSLSDYGIEPIIIDNDTIEKTDLIRRKWLDNNFFGINYNLIYTKNQLNIVIGGGWNKYDGSHFGRIIWMQYAGETPINYEWYKNTGVKSDLNSYIKINYEISQKFNLFTDVQYRVINYTINGIDDNLLDISQSHKYNDFFNPKAGITFQPNDKNNVYASFAMAHREPKRSDFTDAPTNKTPLPEILYDYELGYKLRTQDLFFNINLYYMDYVNQLILTGEINDVGAPIVTNAPKSFRRGIELIFAAKFLRHVNWNANLTLSQNKIENFTEYVDNWDYWEDPDNNPLQITNNLGETDIAFSPSIIASNTLTFKITKFLNIDLVSKYVGRQYIDNTSSIDRSIDPYFVNNLTLRTNFSVSKIRNIEFSVKINNILNEEYETYAWVYSYYYGGKRYAMDGYFPQAGTNFIANLTIKF